MCHNFCCPVYLGYVLFVGYSWLIFPVESLCVLSICRIKPLDVSLSVSFYLCLGPPLSFSIFFFFLSPYPLVFCFCFFFVFFFLVGGRLVASGSNPVLCIKLCCHASGLYSERVLYHSFHFIIFFLILKLLY